MSPAEKDESQEGKSRTPELMDVDGAGDQVDQFFPKNFAAFLSSPFFVCFCMLLSLCQLGLGEAGR